MQQREREREREGGRERERVREREGGREGGFRVREKSEKNSPPRSVR